MFFSGQGSNRLKKYINRKQLEHLILSLTSESQLYPILRQGVKFLLFEEIDLDNEHQRGRNKGPYLKKKKKKRDRLIEKFAGLLHDAW